RCTLQLVVDGDQRGGVEEAPCDARLVRRDHHPIVGLGEPRDGLEAALDRTPLVRRLDVQLAVVVDGAVAIEDDELHSASLEMSATRFMAVLSAWRSASRLRRNPSSSAMTITESKKSSTGALSTAKLRRYPA